jgi:hypothetical protein
MYMLSSEGVLPSMLQYGKELELELELGLELELEK